MDRTSLFIRNPYQISWAIRVSDYSRYLPPLVTVRSTFRVTYWDSAAGGIWMMALGTFIAAFAGKNFDTAGSLKDTADRLFSARAASPRSSSCWDWPW